ncbi:MAG: AAA family ATPase [Candidatus Paceibacterota bacterium]
MGLKTSLSIPHFSVRFCGTIIQNTINSFLNQQLQDDNFQTIKSISEYLVMSAEKVVDKQNKTREESTKIVQEEFQNLLQRLFVEYQINLSWNIGSRKYESSIKKYQDELAFNQLSSGENALISLIFAVYYSKDSFQGFLIDEPEVHLNWQLEEKLFEFFDWFSKEYNKQLIIVTHSRACFVKPFSESTQFFIWENNKIVIKQKPDDSLLSALSGDIVKIIGGITAEDKIVYVEDTRQKQILEKLSQLKSKDVEVVELGTCEKVKLQAKAFKKLNITNVFFLIDGDNKPLTSTDKAALHPNLIQLQKYSIENYFLDQDILSVIDLSNPKKPISGELLLAVKEVSAQNFVAVKTLLTGETSLTKEVLDRLDASAFIKNLSRNLGFNDDKVFMEKYIDEAQIQGKIDTLFEEVINKLFA